MNVITRAKYAELELNMKEVELLDRISRIATEIANDEDSDTVDEDDVLCSIVRAASNQYMYKKCGLLDNDTVTVGLSQLYY